MNRAYVLSNDGRVFYLDPSSTSFDWLETDESSSSIKIKHLSSSDWCLWAISNSFQIYLYVFKLDTPYEFQVTTYENQRRYNLFSSNSFTSKLLSTDRYGFSSEDGKIELNKENFKLPSRAWSWKTDWFYENSPSEGWSYAVDFPAKYHPSFFIAACVRRRVWHRIREFKQYNKYIEVDAPFTKNCVLIDISIGGNLMPYCDKGFLSVWAISNMGKLYFRMNVHHANPEGDSWKEIKLPDSISGIRTCSCSNSGSLFVVTFEGYVLMRTEINRNEPWGQNWILCDSKISGFKINFKEISIGLSQIWALDSQGSVYYRAGMSDERHDGTKWVLIPAKMSSISVSKTNQIWGINSDDGSLYFRYGIDDENLSGMGWKKINLKFRKFAKTLIESHDINDDKEMADFDDNISNEDNDFTIQIPSEENLSLNKEEEDEYNEDLNQGEQAKDTKESLASINYIDEDFSIYDTQVKTYDFKIYEAQSKNEKPLNRVKSVLIDVKAYVRDNNIQTYKDLDEFDKESLDNYIEKFKIDEEPNTSNSTLDQIVENKQDEKARSFSNLSEFSNSTNDTKSIDVSFIYPSSSNSKLMSESMVSDASFLESIELKGCCINSFGLVGANMQVNWYDEKSITDAEDSISLTTENKFIKTVEWRVALLNDLIKRNLREHSNIDKISNPYENDEAWTRKDVFVFIDKANKVYKCALEIETINSKRKSKHEAEFEARLIAKIYLKTRKYLEINIDFKNIVLVTRWALEKFNSNHGFAIFVSNEKDPYVFMTSSENKINDWITQIAMYVSKLSGITSLLWGSSLVSTSGYAYFSFFKKYKPILMSHLNGHFKIVEKHLSGLTFGIGENGKLWILTPTNNVNLDSYNGAYEQTDELEVDCYENQRWNALSGLISTTGLAESGFTTIGFPTDRYIWSDNTGLIERRKEQCILPCPLFKYTSNWLIDYSAPGGVDKDGWQYAFDYRLNVYHGERNKLKDYVRRRRWIRKCKISMRGLWKEIVQTHKLNSISFDMEPHNSQLLPEKRVLLWATDKDGFILSALIHESNPSQFKWHHVSSEFNFQHISIGLNLRIWGVDLNGNVYIRYGVNQKTKYCGEYWSKIKFDETNDKDTVRFKMLSVGNDTVWAISRNNELYFRENISKIFPEGTSWCLIDPYIKFVSVNQQNEVYAITSENAKNRNCLIYRDGITSKNLKGKKWLETINFECKMFSNRGVL